MAEEIFDTRELAELILQGVTRSNSAGDGSGTSILVRDDGTVIIYNLLMGAAPLGDQQLSVEAAGEQRVVNMGWDGSAIIRALTEADGTIRTSLVGLDAGGNEDSLRTNASQQLQIEVVPLETPRQIDSILVPNSEGVLLDGSASLTSSGVYKVTFEVVNIDGTNAVTVSIGVDLAAGGGLVTAEYFMKDVVIPAGGTSGTKVLTMAADDDIRGIAGAANDAAIWFTEVVRVG